jgi:hypothetical protein
MQHELRLATFGLELRHARLGRKREHGRFARDRRRSQTGFDLENTTDGVKPNDAGAQFLASRWYGAIVSL